MLYRLKLCVLAFHPLLALTLVFDHHVICIFARFWVAFFSPFDVHVDLNHKSLSFVCVHLIFGREWILLIGSLLSSIIVMHSVTF